MSVKLLLLLDTLFDSKGELLQLDEVFNRQLKAALEEGGVSLELEPKLKSIVHHLSLLLSGITELSNELE